MKTNFDFTLRGKDWWGPFLGFWVLFLVFYVPSTLVGQMVPTLVAKTGLYFLLLLVSLIAMVILEAIFMIIFLRIVMPKLSIGGKAFAFKGDIGKYLWMNVVGILLSIVTLTIYMPWYIRRIVAYLVSETTFDGTNPEFLSKGGKLFKYFLLALWIPVLVISVVFGVMLGVAIAGSSMGMGGYGIEAAPASTTFVLVLVIFVVIVPFIYLMYKWYVNIRWNDVTIAWKTSFWPSCWYILGQMLLTAITLGIYWPAAVLRLYRYVAAKTVLSKGDAEIGRLGFEGGMGKGFGLIWGQTLLSIITLGIYIPWACANVGRWLLGATFFEQSSPSA